MQDLALTRALSRSRSTSPHAPQASWRKRRGEGRDDLVVTLVTQHAESVLRITRRLSLCDADAEDAYQRAIEILLHRAGSLDPVRAPAWLRTVARHEALAIREQRTDGLSRDDEDPDEQVDVDRLSTEEQVDRVDRFRRAAEALRDLKPDEARALWLRAEGYSYDEIARTNAWTYTKVNRLLAEGRARFLSRYATIESGGACVEWQPVLSAIVDGEADPQARRDAGVHLRSCLGCRATLRQLRAAAPGVRMALPAVGLAGAGGTGLGPDGGGALRFLEGLWTAAHERAASVAVGAQTAVDGLNAGKVAAVTASVAALAGGGVVAVDRDSATARSRAVSGAGAGAPVVARAASPVPSTSAGGATAGSAAPGTSTTTTTTVVAAAREPSPHDREPTRSGERTTPEFGAPAEAADPTAPAQEFRAPDEFSGGSAGSSSSVAAAVPVSPSASPEPASGASGGEFAASPPSRHRGEFAP